MADKNSDREVQKLFSEFVRLRQSGDTPERAWSAVQNLTGDLSSTAKKQLAILIQAWEQRVGENYRPSSNNDTHTTMTVVQKKSVIRPLPPRPTEGNVTRPLPPDELGFEEEQPQQNFDDTMTLLIQIPDRVEPFELVIPQRDEIIIGRSAPDSILLPDIDMTNLPGHITGVSRMHAAIRRNKGSLVVTDLGSKNGTFINGQRLLPQEIRMLRDGDELRIANLSMKIFFHSPV